MASQHQGPSRLADTMKNAIGNAIHFINGKEYLQRDQLVKESLSKRCAMPNRSASDQAVGLVCIGHDQSLVAAGCPPF